MIQESELDSLAAEIYQRAHAPGMDRTPEQRKLRREYSKLLYSAGGKDVLALGMKLVRQYGLRFIPYELVRFHPAAFQMLTRTVLEQLGAGINSWGAVDSFARTLSGPAWHAGLIDDDAVVSWAKRSDIWWRRAALVSTVAWNVRSQGGMGNTEKTLLICEILKSDPEPMVAKALSWALRELTAADPAAVSEFIESNHGCLQAGVNREVRCKLKTGLKNPEKHDQFLPWEKPGWFEEVEDWARNALLSRGMRADGPMQEVQRRPWSVILKTPTTEGDTYCKVCSPVLRHEPGLTKALAAWAPHCSLPVLGSDPQRGYILMPAVGETLRKRFEEGASISLWLEILPVYAKLQIQMIGHGQELLDLGIIDRRLAFLPAQFEVLLSDLSALRIGRKEGLSAEEYEQFKKALPVFERLCTRMGSLGIPETLEHDDFHDANIFYNAEKPVFFDWGESCLAHPFFSMVVGLNSIAYRFNLKPGDAQWIELRDAYLAPWENQFERESLLEAFELSLQVGAVNRALTWYRLVKDLPPRWRRQNADAVPGWLHEYLERRVKSASWAEQ